jgi:hypothetical protein
MGEMRMHNISVGKHDGKRPLGRPGSSWEDNNRRYLREVGLEGVDWINLAQDRDQWWGVVKTVMNLWVPQKARNILTS